VLALVFTLYALLASTFSITKAALDYLGPNLLVAVRMVAAGVPLLVYWWFLGDRRQLPCWAHAPLFLATSFFHVFLSYVPEHWALEYVVSAKACLAFNLSPFITALFERYIFGRRLTGWQLGALGLGFVSFIPLIMVQAPAEFVGGHLWRISLPEVALLVAVISAAYGWILVKQLVVRHAYSPLLVNGTTMLCGGLFALVTSILFEGAPRMRGCLEQNVCLPDRFIIGSIGPEWGGVASAAFYVVLLIVITNVLFYNLYAYLMRCYSATFLSLCGLMTPLFAAAFGFVLRGEWVAPTFFVTLAGMALALFLFYRDETCIPIERGT